MLRFRGRKGSVVHMVVWPASNMYIDPQDVLKTYLPAVDPAIRHAIYIYIYIHTHFYVYGYIYMYIYIHPDPSSPPAIRLTARQAGHTPAIYIVEVQIAPTPKMSYSTRTARRM